MDCVSVLVCRGWVDVDGFPKLGSSLGMTTSTWRRPLTILRFDVTVKDYPAAERRSVAVTQGKQYLAEDGPNPVLVGNLAAGPVVSSEPG